MNDVNTAPNPSAYRLRELDFLRGLAIMLTIIRHVDILNPYLFQMGWIGVDLFFVLSGYLVSGLLFREYKKFGNVEISKFLIRRGFKIYPLYYLLLILYFIYFTILHDRPSIILSLRDVFFVQNYFAGWGYLMPASWSLDVEEHFYFGLAFAAWCLVRWRPQDLLPDSGGKISRLEAYIYAIMILCLGMRLVQNWNFPSRALTQTMTHLRIDSLLMGVLISYWYYFRKAALVSVFQKIRKVAIPLVVLLLSPTPFIEITDYKNWYGVYFMKTIGYTFLFMGFGLLLLYFILTEDINLKLNKFISKPLADVISKVGLYSYGIYIVHNLVIGLGRDLSDRLVWLQNKYVFALFAFTFSILAGKLLTEVVENYFLDVRDKFYPKRTG